VSTTRAPEAGARQAGVTLVELMISMVIGLVIIGALLALYAGSVGTNRVSAAQSEMNEDAQFALKVLTGQLRQAGYNPVHPGQTHTFALPSTHAVFGCTNGFANGSTATSTTALTCNTASNTAGAAISIAYEADVLNTMASGNSPTNCLGTALTGRTDADTGTTYYAAENRYYVKNGTLYCAGVSGPAWAPTVAEQALVENVERIEFSYGSTTVTTAGWTATGAVTGYLTADQLGPATGTAAAPPVHATFIAAGNSAQEAWGTVVAVRVCVVMRSATPVFEDDVTSFGCNAAANAVADKYLRRAYVATVALRNRMTPQ
jgi:type IV pilus assembly protein PilW